MKKQLILLSLLLMNAISMAQETEDAWVFFNAKTNVSASIADPLSILTQRAIDRKDRHNIVIDASDVPVNEAYIAQIKNANGISVFAKSKWFNAIHVRGLVTDIEDVLDFDFVDRIEYADRSLNRNLMNNYTNQNKFQIEDAQVEFVYGNSQNQVEMIAVNELHALNYSGNDMLIAVFDAGFPNINTMGGFERLRNAGHLLGGYDFVSRTANVYDYSGSAHGTKVLSTMAGYIDNQYVGTAPDASYYVFRTEDVDSENPVEESYWLEAAERADSLGVDIINSSLGYKNYDNTNYSYSSSDMNGRTAFITRGATMAVEKGVLVVNSAGNSGTSGMNAPADAQHVLSVGAVTLDGSYAYFSSQGNGFQPTQKPDLVARGLGASVIGSNNSIVQNNGTSFSAPIMSGAIACLWQALPDLSAIEIMEIVRGSASQYNSPDNFLGYGIPNMKLALDETLSLNKSDLELYKLYPNPIKDRLYLNFPKEIRSVSLSIYNILGKLVFSKVTLQNEYIDLSHLNSGVYVAKMETKNNKSYTYKLIKE